MSITCDVPVSCSTLRCIVRRVSTVHRDTIRFTNNKLVTAPYRCGYRKGHGHLSGAPSRPRRHSGCSPKLFVPRSSQTDAHAPRWDTGNAGEADKILRLHIGPAGALPYFTRLPSLTFLRTTDAACHHLTLVHQR